MTGVFDSLGAAAAVVGEGDAGATAQPPTASARAAARTVLNRVIARPPMTLAGYRPDTRLAIVSNFGAARFSGRFSLGRDPV